MGDKFLPVLDEIDVLLAETARLQAVGPQFRIVHRFARAGTCCQGEEVALIILVYRSREYVVRMPLAQRILFDYLARHRWLPQSAGQIVLGLHAEPFYVRHAANVRGSRPLTRKFSRSSVKEYVSRIREALAAALAEAELPIDPEEILVSESTSGNEVGYRVRARIEWTHVP